MYGYNNRNEIYKISQQCKYDLGYSPKRDKKWLGINCKEPNKRPSPNEKCSYINYRPNYSIYNNLNKEDLDDSKLDCAYTKYNWTDQNQNRNKYNLEKMRKKRMLSIIKNVCKHNKHYCSKVGPDGTDKEQDERCLIKNSCGAPLPGMSDFYNDVKDFYKVILELFDFSNLKLNIDTDKVTDENKERSKLLSKKMIELKEEYKNIYTTNSKCDKKKGNLADDSSIYEFGESKNKECFTPDEASIINKYINHREEQVKIDPTISSRLKRSGRSTKKLFNKGISKFGKGFKNLSNKVSTFKKSSSKSIEKFKEGAKNKYSQFKQKGQKFKKGAKNKYSQFKQTGQKFKEGAKNKYSQFKQTGQKFKKGAKNKFGDFKEGAKNKYSQFKQKGQQFKRSAKNKFGDFKEGAKNKFGKFKNSAKNKFGDFKEGAKNKFGKFKNSTKIKQKGQQFKEGAKNKFGKFKNSAKNKFGKFKNSAKNKFGDFKEGAKNKFGKFKNSAKNKFGDFKEGAKNKFGDFKEGAKNKFGDFKEGAKNKFGDFKEGAKNKFGKFKNSAKNKFGDFKEGAKNKFGKFKNSAKNKFGKFKKDIKQFESKKIIPKCSDDYLNSQTNDETCKTLSKEFCDESQKTKCRIQCCLNKILSEKRKKLEQKIKYNNEINSPNILGLISNLRSVITEYCKNTLSKDQFDDYKDNLFKQLDKFNPEISKLINELIDLVPDCGKKKEYDIKLTRSIQFLQNKLSILLNNPTKELTDETIIFYEGHPTEEELKICNEQFNCKLTPDIIEKYIKTKKSSNIKPNLMPTSLLNELNKIIKNKNNINNINTNSILHNGFPHLQSTV